MGKGYAVVSVVVTYEDGASATFQHVVKIRYSAPSKNVEVAENDLTTHGFPIGRALWLQTDNGSISINGTGLRFVDVRKE